MLVAVGLLSGLIRDGGDVKVFGGVNCDVIGSTLYVVPSTSSLPSFSKGLLPRFLR